MRPCLSLQKQRSILHLLMAFILSLSVGCATSYSSGRKGLFDVLADLEETAGTYQVRQGEEMKRLVRYHTKEWSWPLKRVQLTSGFGRRRGNWKKSSFHEGVDLAAKVGTPVYSVSGGTVVYSGRAVSGYGRMVVVRHPGQLFSIYAHHSKNLVAKGSRVKRGQLIARSGKSGRVTGPHLHFELRYGTEPLNPSRYLPRPGRRRKAFRPKQSLTVSSWGLDGIPKSS